LRNDPEFTLPSYTRCSIVKSQRNWADGPAKKELEKMLELHWAVLGCLRNVGVTLTEVIGQYHARGVVPLRRRLLHLYDMMADRPPWVGTGDRTVAPVAARGSAPRDAGDREVVLLVAAVVAAPDAPQRGDTKICKLFVFSTCFIRLLLRC
jgi:hypothetical protein